MSELTNSVVRRAGETERYVREVEDAVVTAYVPETGEDLRGVRIECVIPSKGGGNTRVQLFVPSADFTVITNLMATSHPRRALDAFASAIQATSQAMK